MEFMRRPRLKGGRVYRVRIFADNRSRETKTSVSGTTWVDIGTKLTGSPTYPLDVLAAFSGTG